MCFFVYSAVAFLYFVDLECELISLLVSWIFLLFLFFENF
uniref:Uncharacterized protein n=1 Tax=Rhizophora mucronata TaxID=61149 RepID=A0A2P2QTW2_RHIMU